MVTEIVEKDKIMNNISFNIKKICKSKNISMMWLAEQIDMSYEYLRQIVSPKGKKQLSFYSVYKISKILNISIDDLIKD